MFPWYSQSRSLNNKKRATFLFRYSVWQQWIQFLILGTQHKRLLPDLIFKYLISPLFFFLRKGCPWFLLNLVEIQCYNSRTASAQISNHSQGDTQSDTRPQRRPSFTSLNNNLHLLTSLIMSVEEKVHWAFNPTIAQRQRNTKQTRLIIACGAHPGGQAANNSWQNRV